ncbi:MAG: hypothetical protein PVH61_36875, partial [Candidatus Aminicenantes bacterium]
DNDPTFSDSQKQAILERLSAGAHENLDLPGEEPVCNICKTTIPQMETDISIVDALKDHAVKRIRELLPTEENIKKVKVANFFPARLEKPEDIEKALEEFRKYLLEIIASGMKVTLE